MKYDEALRLKLTSVTYTARVSSVNARLRDTLAQKGLSPDTVEQMTNKIMRGCLLTPPAGSINAGNPKYCAFNLDKLESLAKELPGMERGNLFDTFG